MCFLVYLWIYEIMPSGVRNESSEKFTLPEHSPSMTGQGRRAGELETMQEQ